MLKSLGFECTADGHWSCLKKQCRSLYSFSFERYFYKSCYPKSPNFGVDTTHQQERLPWSEKCNVFSSSDANDWAFALSILSRCMILFYKYAKPSLSHNGHFGFLISQIPPGTSLPCSDCSWLLLELIAAILHNTHNSSRCTYQKHPNSGSLFYPAENTQQSNVKLHRKDQEVRPESGIENPVNIQNKTTPWYPSV